MNTSFIRYMLGQVIKLEGFFLFLPCAVALIYKETSGVVFFSTALLCILLGTLSTLKKPKNYTFYLKDGCITTALSWILLSVFGAIPMYLTGEIPSFVDALFEAASGFTTTGASILGDLSVISHATLFWRSFTHWIGGMGVLVFLLAIVPLSGGSNIHLMRAESPGPSVGKLVPKMRQTARILYSIYVFLTVLQMILLLLGGMPFFDTICTAMGTAGTGGFSWINSGMSEYSPYLQWVTAIFMILFGINFNAYYFILFKQYGKAFKMEEVRAYLLIILVSVGIIFINILETVGDAFEALTHAAFQVASIITTTGYSTADFNLWPETSKFILVTLMFIGACAGSTGGGIKVSRILILAKTVGKEFHSYLHPRSVKKLQMDDKPIEHEVLRSINVFIITYVLLFVSSLFILTFDGNDFTTSFTSIAATINNIGPALGKAGPASNYSFYSDVSKLVMTFDMLAGRLELFPMLLLFHPSIIKTAIKSKLRK